jgi:hypothetical protein
LVGKPEAKRPFGRPTLIWKNNVQIYIYLKEIRWGMWLRIGANRQGSIKLCEFFD